MTRGFLGFVAAGFFAGCAVAPVAFVAEESRSAAVEWSSGGESIELRAEFSTGADDSIRLVVFRERPVLTLVRLRGEWRASGLLAAGIWRGTWNTAPRDLGGWICLAEAIEGGGHAPEGGSEFRTGRMSVRYSKPGGMLCGIELAAVATDDRFRVQFPAH